MLLTNGTGLQLHSAKCLQRPSLAFVSPHRASLSQQRRPVITCVAADEQALVEQALVAEGLSSSTAQDAAQRRSYLLNDIKEALAHDLRTMFTTGQVSGGKYAQDIIFQDPVTNIQGYDLYVGLIKFLNLLNVKLDLHSIDVVSDTQIVARWSMYTSPGAGLLPISPRINFTGTSTYTVDPDAGLVTKHVDKWDALSHQDFVSLEGLAFIARQALNTQITPQDLETPSYDVLVLRNEYELRRYKPFTLAATSMGPGAGPASGTGFGTLASYIFGQGNKLNVSMEMTTPVLTRVGPGGSGGPPQMEFVMQERYEAPDQLPEPLTPEISRERFGGGYFAAIKFSGWPLDHEVVAAERKLRDALFRDGLDPAPGYRLARYNDPTTLPMLRRNEVLIELRNFQWPPAPTKQ